MDDLKFGDLLVTKRKCGDHGHPFPEYVGFVLWVVPGAREPSAEALKLNFEAWGDGRVDIIGEDILYLNHFELYSNG
jgi:hypothetical protein